MPRGCFSVKLSLAHPTWRRPQGRPRTHLRDYISHVAWKHLRIPWKSWSTWVGRGMSGLPCLLACCHRHHCKQSKMDGLLFFYIYHFCTFHWGHTERTDFLKLNPELKCQNPQFTCAMIIISSYRMIPCHRDVSVHARGLFRNKAMKHEKQLDTNSHRLLSKSHPFITQHAAAYSQSNTVISQMRKTTIFLWASKMAWWEICSLVKKKKVQQSSWEITHRRKHIRAAMYTHRYTLVYT